MRKNSLYIGLPLPSIPTELPPSPWSEKVSAFSDILKCMNTIFPEFLMTVTLLLHQNDTIRSLSPLTGISCNIYNGVSGILNDCNGLTTLE